MNPALQPAQEPIREESFILVPETRYSPATRIHPVITHKGLNWYQTHEALHKQSLFMPNPRHLIDLILALESGKLYDHKGKRLNPLDIALLKNYLLVPPGHHETQFTHLDAYFAEVEGEMRMFYNHRTINGLLRAIEVEPLEKSVVGLSFVDIKSSNKQGFPTRGSRLRSYQPGKNAYFWLPEGNSVARFKSDSERAGLCCNGNPLYSDAGLGVYACAKAL